MQKTILFDIDQTLFDRISSHKKFISFVSDICNTKSGIIEELLRKYVKSLDSTSDYDPEVFMTIISQEFPIKKAKLKEILDNETIYKPYLYDDTIKVLKSLKANNYSLGIFSEGNNYFQNHKLNKLGIRNYFDEEKIFIFSRKLLKESLSQIPDNVIIIDDRLNVIEELQKYNKFRPIWLLRNNGIEDNSNKNIEVINSLLELENLIEDKVTS